MAYGTIMGQNPSQSINNSVQVYIFSILMNNGVGTIKLPMVLNDNNSLAICLNYHSLSPDGEYPTVVVYKPPLDANSDFGDDKNPSKFRMEIQSDWQTITVTAKQLAHFRSLEGIIFITNN